MNLNFGFSCNKNLVSSPVLFLQSPQTRRPMGNIFPFWKWFLNNKNGKENLLWKIENSNGYRKFNFYENFAVIFPNKFPFSIYNKNITLVEVLYF